MGDNVHFEGDPATDSSRRHMERVLKGEPVRKWPWFLAAVASGGLWALWRTAGQAQPGPRGEEAARPLERSSTNRSRQPPV